LQVLAHILARIQRAPQEIFAHDLDAFCFRWGWFLNYAQRKPNSPEGKWYVRAQQLSEDGLC
jgi:hypothetical protein